MAKEKKTQETTYAKTKRRPLKKTARRDKAKESSRGQKATHPRTRGEAASRGEPRKANARNRERRRKAGKSAQNPSVAARNQFEEIKGSFGELKKAKGRSQALKETDPDGWLTDKQWTFVENIVHHRMTRAAAARAAGYKSYHQAGSDLMKMPKVQKAMVAEHEEFRRVSELEKRDIVEGFQEAIHVARVQGDAGNMISGYRELAKMLGFYEPVKHTHDITAEGKQLLEKLSQLSDEELLRIAENDELEIIEGQFEEVSTDGSG